MNKIISLLVLALSLQVMASENKTEAQYTVEILDAFCIQNQEDFENIVRMAKSSGGRVLTNEQADAALRELGGKTVYVPYEDRGYVVAFANGGGCTVITKSIDLANLKAILKKQFQTKLIDRQTSLSQINEIHRVTVPGIYEGAVISIVYSQSDTGYTEGSIAFLPTDLVKRKFK